MKENNITNEIKGNYIGKEFNVTNYIKYDIIATSPKIEEEILKDINSYTKNKNLIELGCAEGNFGERVDCKNYTGIDPYAISDHIIKEDAIEYLKKQGDHSIEVLLGKFCIHYFKREELFRLLRVKLKTDGVALFYSISGETTKVFGDEKFNKLFMNNFRDTPHDYKMGIEYFVKEEQMENMVKNLCWTNHQHLTKDEVEYMCSRIPKTGNPLKMMVDINVVKFLV